MGAPTVTDRQSRLAMRIVRALSAFDSTDPSLRPLLENALMEDRTALGEAPLPRSAHLTLARQTIEEAARLAESNPQAAWAAYRVAMTHAWWADALDVAFHCLQRYNHLGALIEQR